MRDEERERPDPGQAMHPSDAGSPEPALEYRHSRHQEHLEQEEICRNQPGNPREAREALRIQLAEGLSTAACDPEREDRETGRPHDRCRGELPRVVLASRCRGCLRHCGRRSRGSLGGIRGGHGSIVLTVISDWSKNRVRTAFLQRAHVVCGGFPPSSHRSRAQRPVSPEHTIRLGFLAIRRAYQGLGW